MEGLPRKSTTKPDLMAVARKWRKKNKKGRPVGGKLRRTKRFATAEDSPIYDEKRGQMQRTEKAIEKPYN